jgi:D-alanine transaminase
MPTAYVDGAFVPLAEARIPLLDRGFMFGDGVYELTAVLDAALVDLPAHLARLERSLGELDMPAPLPMPRIAALHAELVARDALREGFVYLQVTRGGGTVRDYFPAPDAASRLVMFTDARPLLDTPASRAGIAVAILPDQRWARRDIKTVGLLAQVMAKREAAARGCQDAWLEQDGAITEGASSTAFIVLGDAIVTRPNSHAILPGVTRRAVLALAAEQGLRIEERAFTPDEAYRAREAFQTSATTFVLPVVRIDGRAVGDGTPGPLSARLRALYLQAAHAETRQHAAE